MDNKEINIKKSQQEIKINAEPVQQEIKVKAEPLQKPVNEVKKDKKTQAEKIAEINRTLGREGEPDEQSLSEEKRRKVDFLRRNVLQYVVIGENDDDDPFEKVYLDRDAMRRTSAEKPEEAEINERANANAIKLHGLKDSKRVVQFYRKDSELKNIENEYNTLNNSFGFFDYFTSKRKRRKEAKRNMYEARRARKKRLADFQDGSLEFTKNFIDFHMAADKNTEYGAYMENMKNKFYSVFHDEKDPMKQMSIKDIIPYKESTENEAEKTDLGGICRKIESLVDSDHMDERVAYKELVMWKENYGKFWADDSKAQGKHNKYKDGAPESVFLLMNNDALFRYVAYEPQYVRALLLAAYSQTLLRRIDVNSEFRVVDKALGRIEGLAKVAEMTLSAYPGGLMQAANKGRDAFFKKREKNGKEVIEALKKSEDKDDFKDLDWDFKPVQVYFMYHDIDPKGDYLDEMRSLNEILARRKKFAKACADHYSYGLPSLSDKYYKAILTLNEMSEGMNEEKLSREENGEFWKNHKKLDDISKSDEKKDKAGIVKNFDLGAFTYPMMKIMAAGSLASSNKLNSKESDEKIRKEVKEIYDNPVIAVGLEYKHDFGLNNDGVIPSALLDYLRKFNFSNKELETIYRSPVFRSAYEAYKVSCNKAGDMSKGDINIFSKLGNAISSQINNNLLLIRESLKIDEKTSYWANTKEMLLGEMNVRLGLLNSQNALSEAKYYIYKSDSVLPEFKKYDKVITESLTENKIEQKYWGRAYRLLYNVRKDHKNDDLLTKMDEWLFVDLEANIRNHIKRFAKNIKDNEEVFFKLFNGKEKTYEEWQVIRATQQYFILSPVELFTEEMEKLLPDKEENKNKEKQTFVSCCEAWNRVNEVGKTMDISTYKGYEFGKLTAISIRLRKGKTSKENVYFDVQKYSDSFKNALENVLKSGENALPEYMKNIKSIDDFEKLSGSELTILENEVRNLLAKNLCGSSDETLKRFMDTSSENKEDSDYVREEIFRSILRGENLTGEKLYRKLNFLYSRKKEENEAMKQRFVISLERENAGNEEISYDYTKASSSQIIARKKKLDMAREVWQALYDTYDPNFGYLADILKEYLGYLVSDLEDRFPYDAVTDKYYKKNVYQTKENKNANKQEEISREVYDSNIKDRIERFFEYIMKHNEIKDVNVNTFVSTKNKNPFVSLFQKESGVFHNVVEKHNAGAYGLYAIAKKFAELNINPKEIVAELMLLGNDNAILGIGSGNEEVFANTDNQNEYNIKLRKIALETVSNNRIVEGQIYNTFSIGAAGKMSEEDRKNYLSKRSRIYRNATAMYIKANAGERLNIEKGAVLNGKIKKHKATIIKEGGKGLKKETELMNNLESLDETAYKFQLPGTVKERNKLKDKCVAVLDDVYLHFANTKMADKILNGNKELVNEIDKYIQDSENEKKRIEEESRVRYGVGNNQEFIRGLEYYRTQQTRVEETQYDYGLITSSKEYERLRPYIHVLEKRKSYWVNITVSDKPLEYLDKVYREEFSEVEEYFNREAGKITPYEKVMFLYHVNERMIKGEFKGKTQDDIKEEYMSFSGEFYQKKDSNGESIFGRIESILKKNEKERKKYERAFSDLGILNTRGLISMEPYFNTNLLETTIKKLINRRAENTKIKESDKLYQAVSAKLVMGIVGQASKITYKEELDRYLDDHIAECDAGEFKRRLPQYISYVTDHCTFIRVTDEMRTIPDEDVERASIAASINDMIIKGNNKYSKINQRIDNGRRLKYNSYSPVAYSRLSEEEKNSNDITNPNSFKMYIKETFNYDAICEDVKMRDEILHNKKWGSFILSMVNELNIGNVMGGDTARKNARGILDTIKFLAEGKHLPGNDIEDKKLVMYLICRNCLIDNMNDDSRDESRTRVLDAKKNYEDINGEIRKLEDLRDKAFTGKTDVIAELNDNVEVLRYMLFAEGPSVLADVQKRVRYFSSMDNISHAVGKAVDKLYANTDIKNLQILKKEMEKYMMAYNLVKEEESSSQIKLIDSEVETLLSNKMFAEALIYRTGMMKYGNVGSEETEERKGAKADKTRAEFLNLIKQNVSYSEYKRFSSMTDNEQKAFALVLALPVGIRVNDELMSTRLLGKDREKGGETSDEIICSIVKLLSGQEIKDKIAYKPAIDRLLNLKGKFNTKIFEEAGEFLKFCEEKCRANINRNWNYLNNPYAGIRYGMLNKRTSDKVLLGINSANDFKQAVLDNLPKNSNLIKNFEEIMDKNPERLVTVLQNRTILDSSTDRARSGHVVNEEMRKQTFLTLTDREKMNEIIGKSSSRDAYTKAMASLLSFQLKDDVSLDNRLELNEKDFAEGALNRETILDLELLSRALDFVKKMSAFEGNDALGAYQKLYLDEEKVVTKKKTYKRAESILDDYYNRIHEGHDYTFEIFNFPKEQGEYTESNADIDADRKELEEAWEEEKKKYIKEFEEEGPKDISKEVFLDLKELDIDFGDIKLDVRPLDMKKKK